MDNPQSSRLVDTFLTLVNFNTPPKHEKPASEWAAQYLQNIGFETEFDDAGEKSGGQRRQPHCLQKRNSAGRAADFLFRPL